MNITLQPRVLRWVRERAGLSKADLADGLGLGLDKVEDWERRGALTFGQAERIANKTHARWAISFCRTAVSRCRFQISGRWPGSEHRSQVLNSWIRLMKPSVAKTGTAIMFTPKISLHWIFVESISLNTNHDIAAQSIRDRVGFQTEIRALASTWETALTLQIEQIEESGVLVMRNGIVGANTHRPLSVEEFRGFALADKYAPLIFLNGADGKAAQMFTLAHELVHIWLGESGISNLSRTYAVAQRVEAFCNSVAAKVLAPDGEVQASWPEARTKESPWEWIGRRFKLSSLVVLRRFADLRLIRRSEFDRAYEEQEQKFAQLEARTGGGGNYYTVQKYRVSPRFARAVIESTAEGKTSFRDALNLLGMKKTDTFRRFAKEQFDFSF